jgi:hypothetical protein
MFNITTFPSPDRWTPRGLPFDSAPMEVHWQHLRRHWPAGGGVHPNTPLGVACPPPRGDAQVVAPRWSGKRRRRRLRVRRRGGGGSGAEAGEADEAQGGGQGGGRSQRCRHPLAASGYNFVGCRSDESGTRSRNIFSQQVSCPPTRLTMNSGIWPAENGSRPIMSSLKTLPTFAYLENI